MYHLRLVKGMSYLGAVTATKKNPDVYVESAETADNLVDSGYFKYVGQTDDEKSQEEDISGAETKVGFVEKETADDEVVKPSEKEKLSEMNMDDLKGYAKVYGIDLSGCSKKAEIIQRIMDETAKADEARNAMRDM